MQRKLDYTQEEVRVLKEIVAALTGNGRLSFNADHLRRLIKEFVEHYMTERFHQGLGGQLIRNVGPTNDNGAVGKVVRRSRLGGMLNCYSPEAA
jgi:transposase InsO family protein